MSPRPQKFRFYLDENFPLPAGKFLKSLGHNVEYAVNKRTKKSLSDLAQIKYATKNNRIIIARDKDFVSDKTLAQIISSGPGILLTKSTNPNSKNQIMILKKVLKILMINQIKGKICLVSKDKIKFVKLI